MICIRALLSFLLFFFSIQVGDVYDNNCEQRCECEYGGKWKCEDICQKPFIKRGQKIDDPSCSVKDYDDECCDMLICNDNKTVEDDLKIGEFVSKL